jgi:hypothetical protein
LSVQIAVLSLIRRTIKAGVRGVQFIILMGDIRGCDTDESHLLLKIQRQVRGREARKSPIKIPRSGSTGSSVKRKAKEEEIKGYENADGYSDMAPRRRQELSRRRRRESIEKLRLSREAL